MLTPIEFTHQEDFGHLSNSDALITGLLDERDQAMQLVDEVLSRLTQLNNLMERDCKVQGRVHNDLVYDLVNNISFASKNFSCHREEIRKNIDGRYWKQLLKKSRCTTLMNTSDKKKVEDRASKDAPAFEFGAVVGTVQDHYENRMLTFVKAGVDLFSSLNVSFKSNDRICLRKKIIFDNALTSTGWSMYGSSENRIHDLERTFMILDGKDPGSLHHKDTAPYRIERAKNAGENTFEHEYFTAKLFGNGNIHLIFTRHDLVEKFNGMLSIFHGQNLGFRTAKH